MGHRAGGFDPAREYADRGDPGSPGPRRFRIDPLASTKTAPLETAKAAREDERRTVHEQCYVLKLKRERRAAETKGWRRPEDVRCDAPD
ncbi:MAG: hypothetical protein WCA20_28610 [Candidatus Sulfotelmatobacter sp.]